MESNTTFFTGTIDPQTGDIRSVRIDTRRELTARDLVVDVHYSADIPHVKTYDEQMLEDAERFYFIPVPEGGTTVFEGIDKYINVVQPNTDPTLAQFCEPKREADHEAR